MATPLFSGHNHNVVHVALGLGSLWFGYKSIRAGYRAIRMRNLPSELREIDHLIAAMGIPDEYYMGKRAIRTGVLNVIGGVAVSFVAISLVLNIEFLARIGVVALALFVVSCALCLVFDPPWKVKKG